MQLEYKLNGSDYFSRQVPSESCLMTSHEFDFDLRQVIFALSDALDLVGVDDVAHGKRVGYEALAWGRHVSDHRDAWALVRDVDHPAIGLVLDSFHSLSRRIPSSSIGDIRADKLFIVQVADAPYLDMDTLNWSRHFRCMPGQGDFPLADYAAAIRRIGYDGYFSLEIFNDRFRSTSAGRTTTISTRSPSSRGSWPMGRSTPFS